MSLTHSIEAGLNNARPQRQVPGHSISCIPPSENNRYTYLVRRSSHSSYVCLFFVPRSTRPVSVLENPLFFCHSVLRVYLGMVLHANKRYMDALDMLEQASKSEPSNPQVGRAGGPHSSACYFSESVLSHGGHGFLATKSGG